MSLSAPSSDISVDGFINEPSPEWESPEITSAEQDLLFGAQTEPAAPQDIEAAPLNEEPTGPFTGLELESNAFVEQSRSPAAPSSVPFAAFVICSTGSGRIEPRLLCARRVARRTTGSVAGTTSHDQLARGRRRTRGLPGR